MTGEANLLFERIKMRWRERLKTSHKFRGSRVANTRLTTLRLLVLTTHLLPQQVINSQAPIVHMEKGKKKKK